MISLGTVREDQTIYFYFSAAAADGGEENFSATLEQADIPIHKDGSVMTLDASTITITNVATGLYKLTIDLSNDADFTGGSDYWVMVDASDETIDSQAVSGVLGHFRIESASEKATRLLRDFLYPTDSVISTTTNNTTTSINLTDIVDAQTTVMQGEILAVHDATNDAVWIVRVTSFTYPQATVEILDGGEMPAAVASGDHIWRVGQHTATKNGATEIAGQTSLDSLGDSVNAIGTDVDSVEALVAASAIRSALGLSTADLDTQLSTISAKTNQLTFTVSNVVDAHIQYVAGEAVDGAGTEADPWGPA